MKQKKQASLNLILVLFTLLPIIITVTVLAIVTSRITVDKLEANIREELNISSQGLLEYYQYDLINGHDLVDGFLAYDTEYVDSMGKTGVDYTIFKENVRFVTNILDKNGKRIEGTKAGDAVWAAVKAGNSYYSDALNIEGIPYYGFYLPLKGADGEVVGMSFAGKPAIDVEVAQKTIIMAIVSLSIGLVVIFGLIAIFIARKISKQLKIVTDGIETLSEGDTSVTIETKTSIRETYRLLEASNKLAGALNDSIGQIRTCADTLVSSVNSTNEQTRASAESISQINVSMNDLSQTTVSMAGNVQDISSEIIEMGQMIETAADNADGLSDNATSMDNANAEASECIENVVNSSNKSSNAIDIIIDRIKETDNSILKINEMVNMITDIASQTNLLALNASIEAARAGEAGRGFAVVAEEIGKLAAQSNDSARQINDIVDEIGKQSKECVDESANVKSLIDEEKSLLSTTLEKFKALDANIKSSVEEISVIAGVTKKLESVKNKVTSAISDLSAISQETSATNEEVSATVEAVSGNMQQLSYASDDMSGVAKDLENAVSYFK
ncbi:MAG: cache domain-containing protein [Lachnospiraceae bacterium]|nr:cache domain-containing protein [Lachnospiraceae bacterium]